MYSFFHLIWRRHDKNLIFKQLKSLKIHKYLVSVIGVDVGEKELLNESNIHECN